MNGNSHMATKELHQLTGFDLAISPLSRTQFLSEFWGESFLRTAGEKGRFQSLLPWTELNSILEGHRLEPPRFRLWRDGKPVDRNRYLSVGGAKPCLKPASLINCLAEGATLILDHIEDFAPHVRELIEAFEEVFRTRVCANLYAGWRTQKGFD